MTSFSQHGKAAILKFSGLLALTLMASVVLAQSSVPRVALVEQVTSASCGPCASQNPAFNVLLGENEGDVAVIKYQRGGGGYIDPMWSFNPSQVDSRIPGYYSTNSFPNVWMNGNYYVNPASVDQTDISGELTEAPGFHIYIQQWLNTPKDTLFIEVTYTALMDLQEPEHTYLKGYAVVTEKEVNYPSPPGLNGETEFSNVMRYMFPSTSGEILGKQFEGDQTTVSYSYAIDGSEIDPDMLNVVSFVQVFSTQEVLQAGYYNENQAPFGTASGIAEFAELGELTAVATAGQLQISFDLAASHNLSFSVYDMYGKLIATQDAQPFSSGPQRHNLSLSGKLAAGNYALVVDAGKAGSKSVIFQLH